MKMGSRPSGKWMSMKPPPPMLPASGKVTARANAVATAASMALPPLWRMSAPTLEASEEAETTTPCSANSGEDGGGVLLDVHERARTQKVSTSTRMCGNITCLEMGRHWQALELASATQRCVYIELDEVTPSRA